MMATNPNKIPRQLSLPELIWGFGDDVDDSIRRRLQAPDLSMESFQAIIRDVMTQGGLATEYQLIRLLRCFSTLFPGVDGRTEDCYPRSVVVGGLYRRGLTGDLRRVLARLHDSETGSGDVSWVIHAPQETPSLDMAEVCRLDLWNERKTDDRGRITRNFVLVPET